MVVATSLPRDRLVAELAAVFPEAVTEGEPAAAAAQPCRGGRLAAEQRLAAVAPAEYSQTRNFVTGAVSRLSPWIRHGVVSLAEVRDRALEQAGPGAAEKFISELGWRGRPAASPRKPLVWITLDSLSPRSPAAAAWPDAPRLFVADRAWLAAERPALKRLVFIWECLADLPAVEIDVGDPAQVLPARAAALGCDGVVVADTPCPLVRRSAAAIGETLPVRVEPWPRFCDDSKVRDLGRFSRYWNKVKASALRPTAG